MFQNSGELWIYRGGSKNLRRGVLFKECAQSARKNLV